MLQILGRRPWATAYAGGVEGLRPDDFELACCSIQNLLINMPIQNPIGVGFPPIGPHQFPYNDSGAISYNSGIQMFGEIGSLSFEF